MLTFEEVKTRIVVNHWDGQALDTIAPALPKLGQFSLNYIYNRTDELSGNFAISFAQLAAQLPTWQAQIQNNDEDSLTASLVQILREGNLTKLKLASSFISDVHDNKALSNQISPHFNRTLYLFQMAQAENLPASEIASALQLHPVDIAMIFDLEEELKRYAYYKNYDNESKELAAFRLNLENSQQIVAGHGIKDLIADFHDYASRLPAKSSSYAVVQYITASPAAKSFSKSDATLLTRILGAHSWLLQGRYADKEIEQYDESREQIIEKLPELIITPPEEALGSYEVEIEQPEVYPEGGIFSEQVEDEERHVAPEPKPQTTQPTMAQKKIMQDIAAKAHKDIRYNADGASIRNLINHKPAPRGGLVLERQTNIKMNEEVERIRNEQKQHNETIQGKLEELRKRNNNA